jgi:SAM-dependent methyltransferase
MNKYFLGEALYGDEFTIDEIKKWYEEEAEAYADLGSKELDKYEYGYHPLNLLHGFKYLKGKKFENVLGLGAAWGHEYHPIINDITNLYIIEPSENLRSEKIKQIVPVYTKPNVDGTINYPDNFFDLVTSFGTLHHVPNVSFVIKELYRVTKPGGHILLREPIISMGDWTKPRKGLTCNERGIPLNIFRSVIKEIGAEIVNEGFCFAMTAFFQRGLSKISKRPVYTYKTYLLFDKWFSKAMQWNLQYHATNKLKRIAPQSVFYVLRKPL